MPKKVFELAKELELKPLDLVEELKTKGFDSIKNHMSVLSDDDLAKFESLKSAEAKAAEENAATKKKTKKKTTKKKAKTAKTAKKVAKKAKTTKAAAKAGDDAPKKKATTVRKKTVIRRKSGEKEEAPAEEVLETSTVQTEEVNTPEVEVQAKAETSDEKKEGGLQVVSRPEAPAEEKEAEPEKKEIYEEKVHKFTPVFIPEKSEEKEEKPAAKAGAPKEEFTEDDDKKGDAKKKFGGLASMMSGKKANVSKSALLTQTRADSELKSYAALSGSGRPIYTQVKKKRIYSGATNKTEITEVKDSKRVVNLHGGATVVELAKKLKVKSKELVDKALEINLLLKNDDYVGIILASELAELYNYRVEDKKFDEDAVLGNEELSEEEKSNLPVRNPIITIMGHVDHGKTTLLDHIRSAKVCEGEAGGITQHIGAYSVNTSGGKTLTFLDTPGHAAFASMRQRGADVTDIVVLVVAADDGVMPQTKESIKYCENSGCPIIIAVNKMDKEGVNTDRIKSELSEYNLAPEDWGGTTQYFPISALKGDGIDELLDGIGLQAEMMELRADPKGGAEGVVIESKIEQGRGPMSTILVQKGTLKKGDTVVVGETYGRARSLMDSKGEMLSKVGPSMPVQILGLNEPPSPGDQLNVVKNEREAKKIVQNRLDEKRKLASVPTQKQVSLEDFFASAAGEGVEQKTLNLIIRSDVQGSFEAIKQSLEPLANSEVDVKVIGGGVGPITDSDISLADSSGAVVIGFGMRPVTTARRMAEEKGIDVKTYQIIYELIDDVKAALEGLLDPDTEEKFIGRAEVKDTFVVPKIGQIAGSLVVDGKIQLGCHIRLLRGGRIMFDGELSSLKRFKDDVKEVKNGLECGIGLKDFNDLKVGDLFEAYMLVEKKRTLEDVELAEIQKAEEAEAAAAAMAAESEEVENENSL
ncbi:MAG: translation initiation factor IF-2 [Halobacteriovorax sp.]|nr:translation initiation factor IF-2 [Halobacteriovorax sp.]|tara:strand:- start:56419 stop:59196 length:2778 start_codon:yes stop_codon:yes gene_type:complete